LGLAPPAGHLSLATDAARLARPDEALDDGADSTAKTPLAIYCLGVLLSFMGFVILSQFSSTIAVQVVISIVGIALMIAAATLTTWTSKQDRPGPNLF
jgi:OpgC protein